MSRSRPTGYVGATKSITLADARKLPSTWWAVQRKRDGIYVTATLDGRGRVRQDCLHMRSGAEVPRHLTSHLAGALVGAPHAALVGEFDAMTEAGEAAAKIGPRRLTIFDCLHDGTRSLLREPYAARRDAALRMTEEVQRTAPDDDHRPKPWRRYRDPVEPGWKLCPVIEQAPMEALGALYEKAIDADLEGLVIVNQRAPVGRPASKLKLKPIDQLDAQVVAVHKSGLTLLWRGVYFGCSPSKLAPEVGEVVSVAHNGFYAAANVPRFARIAAVRRDLGRMA